MPKKKEKLDKTGGTPVEIERLVKMRLTKSEIETLKETLQYLDATCDDRDPNYTNLGTINKKYRKAVGIEDAI